jgi:hypothetical protein
MSTILESVRGREVIVKRRGRWGGRELDVRMLVVAITVLY